MVIIFMVFIWNVIGFCFGVFIFWLCQVLVVAYGILFIYFSFKLFFLGFFFFKLWHVGSISLTRYWICCRSVTQSCPTVTPWTAACQASLSFTSWSLLKLMSIELVMPSNHLILCCPLLLPPSIFPSIRVFQWVGSLHQVAKVLELQLQHQSFQRIFGVDFL